MKKFNVLIYNFNERVFEPYDIIPPLVKCYKKSKHKLTTFDEFKEFVDSEAMYHWWAKCEYEILLVDWPNEKIKEKIDVYLQVKMNLDVITSLLMESI